VEDEDPVVTTGRGERLTAGDDVGSHGGGAYRCHYRSLVPTPDVERYEFLSDGWLDAVAALRDASDHAAAPAMAVSVNLVVTEVPFSPGEDLLVHADTSAGSLIVGRGHLARADVTITVAWATAKALLVEGNQQAAMSAFLEGKVRVEGDVGKLLAFQSGVIDESTHETARTIKAFTA
jgi:hypothetical protein